VVCISCKQNSAIPSLRETFSKKDKIPFGSYIFYDQLKLLYNRNLVKTKTESFENFWKESSDTDAVYICISKNLFLSPEDKNAMLDYVNSGNSLFISSQYIDSSLLNTLGCKIGSSWPIDDIIDGIKYTSVRMDTLIYEHPGPYTYFYLPLNAYFDDYDTSTTSVLGKNKLNNPNFMAVLYGKGRFYLHCEPRALSNYFLLQKNNYSYLQNILAFTKQVPQHVYWDDYYNKRNHADTGNESKGGIKLLLQYPAMASAFWLLLLLLALYILFGGKRRQRIVKTIPLNTNSSIAFAETVAHLYLQKKDNRNIAEKMILYFQEYIRKQYFLNTSQVNDDFKTMLSKKSNVPKEAVEKLFYFIQQILDSQQITDEELLLLNQQIENFYKNKR